MRPTGKVEGVTSVGGGLHKQVGGVVRGVPSVDGGSHKGVGKQKVGGTGGVMG